MSKKSSGFQELPVPGLLWAPGFPDSPLQPCSRAGLNVFLEVSLGGRARRGDCEVNFCLCYITPSYSSSLKFVIGPEIKSTPFTMALKSRICSGF